MNHYYRQTAMVCLFYCKSFSYLYDAFMIHFVIFATCRNKVLNNGRLHFSSPTEVVNEKNGLSSFGFSPHSHGHRNIFIYKFLQQTGFFSDAPYPLRLPRLCGHTNSYVPQHFQRCLRRKRVHHISISI